MPLTITSTRDDGVTADITQAAHILIDEIYWTRVGEFLTLDQMLTVREALAAIGTDDALYAVGQIDSAREAAEAAQRRRDEWQRTQAERLADHTKAAAQLAAEMREAEPALVRAGWTDAQLVQLRYMRNAGMA